MHDIAWGGYIYSGRVRLGDGKALLIRESVRFWVKSHLAFFDFSHSRKAMMTSTAVHGFSKDTSTLAFRSLVVGVPRMLGVAEESKGRSGSQR